ncbi:MAG: hypothetical protein ACI8ZM_000419 [Crocinitomix sp.]|jgi:hypothetical protein
MLTINPSRIAVLLISLFFLSCQIGQGNSGLIEGEVDPDYELIRDGLYQGVEGNLYFRTLDRSSADDPENPELGLRYDYSQWLYVDSLAGEKEILTTPNLRDVVDAGTFHKTEGEQQPKNPDGSSPLTISYYADKNNTYYLVHVADGGVLHKK